MDDLGDQRQHFPIRRFKIRFVIGVREKWGPMFGVLEGVREHQRAIIRLRLSLQAHPHVCLIECAPDLHGNVFTWIPPG